MKLLKKTIEVIKRLQPYTQFNYYENGQEHIFTVPYAWAKKNVKRVGYMSIRSLRLNGSDECFKRFVKMAISDEVGGYMKGMIL